MPAASCPYCQVLVQFTSIWETTALPQGVQLDTDGVRSFGAFECGNELCGMVIVGLRLHGQFLRTWPELVSGKTFPDVPGHIAEAADEAYLCLGIQAYRATVLLARAVVEATAKDK